MKMLQPDAGAASLPAREGSRSIVALVAHGNAQPAARTTRRDTRPSGDLQTQLEERLRFETLLADLSTRFVSLSAQTLDREIEDAQRRICQTLNLDRSTLMQFTGPDGEAVFTHCWAVSGFEPNPLVPVGKDCPWVINLAKRGQTVRFTSVDELPAEAATDKETFRRLGTKSKVAFPLIVGGRVHGALAFAALKSERGWPEALLSRLRLVSELFAGALARRQTELELNQALAEVEKLKELLHAENVSLRQRVEILDGLPQIVGRSPAIQNALAQVRQVAKTAATVLLLGETGTGKERFAAAIHDLSARRDRPMIRVNCAAIPQALIESELFGRERGAYTGAMTKQLGRFEAAHRSTLFLDEIGELPAETQVKLLRVLEQSQIERLGSPKPIAVDVRVISATNCDLEKAVESGKFRQDLYYRLNVFPIRVPPLRERREDIPMLVSAFVEQFGRTMGKTTTSIRLSDLDALQRYAWPGNVRELRNLIERAFIAASGPNLIVEVPRRSLSPRAKPLDAREAQRQGLLLVLERTGWRVQGKGGAAEILGLKRTTLESRMSKLGIRRPTR
jgi:transcriptional regulator with GAF, ATPase, and Fis domain